MTMESSNATQLHTTELRQRTTNKPKEDDSDPSPPLIPDDKIAKTQKDRPVYVTYGLETNPYALLVLTTVAAIVRLYKISNPPAVVFDEVHFGGFASKYINGKFFMDVHPPLGKLLIAAAGMIAGFDGSFDFKEIGKDYLEPKVPYIAMRMLPGILGVLLVPIAYITMRNCGFSNISSVLTATLLIFENGFATQSRLILLDSILVFFTGLSTMMWTDFLSTQDVPFTFTWWYPLVMTGISLGLSLSIKWVGLFVFATVGFSTVMNLWELLGDVKRVSVFTLFKHFMARALCLIVIPLSIYAVMFQVHFMVLVNNGTGNGFMSPEFQSTLGGSSVAPTYKEVAFGSKVIIRHSGTNGGYLHSHNLYYQTGSKQQQITCYPFKDENNDWIIKPMLETVNGTYVEKEVGPFERLKVGDIVRFEHSITKKHLHSHNHKAPVSNPENHFEVSAYGAKGYLGDTNDHWRIEVPDQDEKNPYIDAMTTKFSLIHVNLGCKLFSHNVKLPDWGSGQQEVTCVKSGKKTHVLWRIESNENPNLLQNATKINYPKPGFWGKFFEIHQKMWTINAGLKGSHPFDSRPIAWPGLRRGISFWTNRKGGVGQIYLLGNPFVWWLGISSCVLVIIGFAAYWLLQKRNITVIQNLYVHTATRNIAFMFMAWALHYAPFFLMARQLFLHHYFPALFYSILLFGAVFDLITYRLTPATRLTIAVIAGLVAIYYFWEFSPLTYGTPMTKEHCEKIKWRKTWDWDCSRTESSKPPKPVDQMAQDDQPVKIDESD